MVQWLRLNAWGHGLDHDTKILQAVGCNQKEKKEKTFKGVNVYNGSEKS